MISFRIRSARPDDVAAIATLCEEHAAFERNPFPTPLDPSSIGATLFGDPVRLWALVVEDTLSGCLVGYATYTVGFSTWLTADYLHLDCLFLQADYRGSGIGRALMEQIRAESIRLGCPFAEWQTPSWNEAAGRFYLRLGATEQSKRRFTWNISESLEECRGTERKENDQPDLHGGGTLQRQGPAPHL
jgi:ribosomal protein S18 acetylase RimI-like enzyme